MLIGNLGKDPDIQFLEGNIGVAKFSLATTETYKDRSGKLISQTEWHTIVLWRGLEAAEEIARQLRLRDLGGIIVVDFIDMRMAENKKKLADAMDQYMRVDRAKHAVLAITKFGLMQITRQRMKPEMNINTSEVCPSCEGTGKISSTLILEDEIFKNLNYLIMQKHKHLTVSVHPILYTYLTSGFPSRRMKWSWKFKQKIKVIANSSYHLTEFRFYDESDEEIKL